MRWFYELPLRLRSLFHKTHVEQDLTDELRFHLERLIDEKVAKGMPPEEARYAARRELGGVEQIKEECRDARRVNYIEGFLQDARYGLRTLAKSPGFTAVAVMSLTLGIGATTAIFSVVDSVLLRPAPYAKPSELVDINEMGPETAAGATNEVPPGDFIDWQEQAPIFQGTAAYERWEFHTLIGGGEPDEVWAVPVTTNLFRVLGVNAFRGRTFASNETQAVVLSHQYWESHFSSDPKIIGKVLAVDDEPYTVVGIAPADFEFPRANTQIWVPLTFSAAQRADHEDRRLSVIARLKPGVSLRQAQALMNTVSRHLAAQFPKTNAGWSYPVSPFKGPVAEGVLRTAIFALLGAVTFVLLIVGSNVASMLLARGTMRQGEMAIRAALGAGRLRLIRQLVVESVLLAVAGGVGGLMLARWGLSVIVNLVPKYNLVETESVHHISMNLAAFAFTAALCLLTGVAVGLLPALRVSSLNLSESLKERGRNSAAGARGSRLLRTLVVSEVALALALLVGAGLMIQSFQHLETTPTGFNPDHLLTVRVPLMSYKYSPPQSADFYREVLERIQAIPGVKSVGMANNLPFTGFHLSLDFPAPPNSPGGSGPVWVVGRSVSPDYFRAMQIPLIRGRDFTEAENQKDAPCVRIVNQTMARLYFPGQNPIGKQLHGACPNDAPATVVGVVADSKQDSVDSEPHPELYEPYAQHPFASFLVTFVIRTASNPTDVAAAVRQAVRQVDSDQPVIQMRTMQDVVSESIWRQHVSASMLGLFAALALLLSAVGVYGTLSYSVSQRTREIGIRVALGAERRAVLCKVMGQGINLTLIGVAIGIAGALALTRFLSSLLYGVKPTDPLTFVTVSLILTAVALLASYIPARRATKVDPMVALRHE
ncbi:MAG TPA: ABC transporter permease [Terriglobia bacterium]|nr:ABC transporter permease [Terriglobia bacterium]